MGFVSQFSAHRILKRARGLRGRPAWQDQIPESKSGKDTYRIAAKNQGKFSRAFLDAIKNILPEKMSPEFRQAFNRQDAVGVQQVIPLFAEGSTDQDQAWKKFEANLQTAYMDVMDESGKAATTELNKDFKTKLGFSLVPLSKAEIDEEQVLRGRAAATEAARGFIVPVNPYSVAWMSSRSLKLVQQGITDQQKQVVQTILSDNFERGVRAENAYKQIRDNIGLTNRDFKATQNRRALLERQGFDKKTTQKYVDKYRGALLKKRAERIARTETIAAQARGRNDAWKIAQESGALPAVERVWISAPPSSDPYRPCDQCIDLDGKTAQVGKAYDSIEGPIEEPPAHPDCRCTESIQRAGKATKPTPPRPTIKRPEKKPIAMPPKKLRPKPKAPKVPAGRAPRTPLKGLPRESTVLPNSPTIFAQAPLTDRTRPKARPVITVPRSGKKIALDSVQQAALQNSEWISKNINKRLKEVTSTERKSFIQWNWVHGAKRKMSIRMKMAIKQSLGLKGVVYNPRNFAVSQVEINLIKKDMKAVYKNTQKELQAKGIKKLRVFRGLKGNVKETGVMESWTTDPKVARGFGRVVVTKDIPASKVYNYTGSSNWINGIHGFQKEVIVLE